MKGARSYAQCYRSLLSQLKDLRCIQIEAVCIQENDFVVEVSLACENRSQVLHLCPEISV